MSNVKTIIALVGDKERVVFYYKDGTTQPMPVDQKITDTLVNRVTEALAQNQEVTIDLDELRVDFYKQVEKKSNGLIRFYKVAKAALLGTPRTDHEMHHLHSMNIIAPLSASELTENETIVAVVRESDSSEPVLVEDAHLLERQVAFAARDGEDTASLQAFLLRLGKVQKVRQHSAQDLLQFLKNNDLPLTKSGQIIAYKRLNKDSEEYVDSHTGRVKQRIGSRVFMAPSMVNPDRRAECSNGLHVGRRDYMGHFSGRHILLVLVNPEDVIAVPRDYGCSKMRCCSYHIVAEVSGTAFNNLTSNESMTVQEREAKLLRQIIEGQHIPVTNTVEITQSNGRGLVFTEFNPSVTPGELVEGIAPAHSIEETDVDSQKAKVDPTLNSPKAIKERLAKVTTANPPAEAPVPEMTPDQQWAKDNWHKVTDGTLTKIALAKMCNTSTRSLDRWKEKFNF